MFFSGISEFLYFDVDVFDFVLLSLFVWYE